MREIWSECPICADGAALNALGIFVNSSTLFSLVEKFTF